MSLPGLCSESSSCPPSYSKGTPSAADLLCARRVTAPDGYSQSWGLGMEGSG